MATAIDETDCTMCDKEKDISQCEGCQQELNNQLDEIEMNRDLFRQSLTQQIQQANNHSLIEEINKWEQNSINIIQQTANEARQILLENINKSNDQLEIKLNELDDRLKQSREENNFNENNLHKLREELNRLIKKMSKSLNISIRKDPSSFITKISVHVPESTLKSNYIHYNTKWVQNGLTIIGGNGEGNRLNQLHSPYGMYVNDDRTVYVIDHRNHRIMKWSCGAINGQIVAGGNRRGSAMNQLNHPTDMIFDKERNNLIICDYGNRRVVRWLCQNGIGGEPIILNINCSRLTMDNDGYLYISDSEKNEVRRWNIGDDSGTLVAGGNGKGSDLNQLNFPTCIFVDDDHSVYVSDRDNQRVMKWMEGAKEGIVVAGGHGKGNDLSQLSNPLGVIVDHLNTVYVADSCNHRIMRWFKGATQGDIVVGGYDQGEQENQLHFVADLSFDRQGRLYVLDYLNARVQRFDINQN